MKRLMILLLICSLPILAQDKDLDLDLPVDPYAKPAPKAPPKPGEKLTPPLPPLPPLPPKPPAEPSELPPRIYGKELTSKSDSIIYVIDISGSMGFDVKLYTGLDGEIREGNRLDRAKAEVVRSIYSLPKHFEFNIVAYDCSIFVWQEKLVQATPEEKESGKAWVMKLWEGGGTGTGPAVEYALLVYEKNKLIVLLTDGDPNCGAGSEFDMADARKAHLSRIRWANRQKAQIDVFGISATGEFKQFCMDVASQNGGNYKDVN